MHKLLDIIHKPPLLTVRTVLIAVMTLFVTLPSHAQEGLAVNGIFLQYGHAEHQASRLSACRIQEPYI